MNTIVNLTPKQLRDAAKIQEQILSLQEQLQSLPGVSVEQSASEEQSRRRLSPAGLARIRAAQRKRWAATRKKTGSSTQSKKGKGKISAAGRARIAAALKARWAAAKRAGRSAL